MREILFRGKLKAENSELKKGDWVYGDFVTLVDGKEKHPHIYGKGEVKAETIGQYTGLTDKNGTKIFEGDIIRALMDFGPAGYYPQIVSVGWDDMQGYQWNYFLLDTLEVIGNIHDNPELLKELGE